MVLRYQNDAFPQWVTPLLKIMVEFRAPSIDISTGSKGKIAYRRKRGPVEMKR